MYASCTFFFCVLHQSSCNLMLTVITDLSFVAFEWSAAWIMFTAYPAYMEVTCPMWCFYDLLRCLYKYHVQQCEPHLDFSHVMFWFLFMNAGYYIIFDLTIFHFTVLFCGTETCVAQGDTQYSQANTGVQVMQSLELVLFPAACTFIVCSSFCLAPCIILKLAWRT